MTRSIPSCRQVGKKVAVVDPLLGRVSTAYDAAGRTLRRQDALGFLTTSVYDAAGQRIAAVDPLGNRSSTVYDPAGRSVADVNALNQRTTNVYDVAGEKVAAVDPLGRRSSTCGSRKPHRPLGSTQNGQVRGAWSPKADLFRL